MVWVTFTTKIQAARVFLKTALLLVTTTDIFALRIRVPPSQAFVGTALAP